MRTALSSFVMIPLWQGIFALPLSSFVMIAQDGKQLHNHGMLHGFNWVHPALTHARPLASAPS